MIKTPIVAASPPNPMSPAVLAMCKEREAVISKYILPTLKKIGYKPEFLRMQSWQDANDPHWLDPFIQGKLNSTGSIKRTSYQTVTRTRDTNLNECVDIQSYSEDIPMAFRQFCLKHPACAILNASEREIAEGVCKGHFISSFDVSKAWIRLPYHAWESICKDFK